MNERKETSLIGDHQQLLSLRRTSTPIFLMLSVVLCCPSAITQELEKTARRQFFFFPGFRFCNPAEVKGFALGKPTNDALLAQVYVESRSEKAIAAVKLSWKVYDSDMGHRVATSACTETVVQEGLLSGGTDFIDLKSLEPREVIAIGTHPLPMPNLSQRAIFVARPFVTVDDIKSVVGKAEGRMYLVVLYVSEIRFENGTTWALPLRFGNP
jgi:hypothetical protein